MKAVIINADDFGINHRVNRAIIESFEQGIISSTTILTNMPGFEDAIDQYRAYKFLNGKVGVHLNLTEGPALTEKIRIQKRFCDTEGKFIYHRKKSLFYLDADEKLSIYQELKAQIVKAINNNIIPSHIDSHHHVHTEAPVLNIVIQILKELKINKIRIAKNMLKENTYLKETYKYGLNFFLKYKGFTCTNYFGGLNEFIKVKSSILNESRTIEIMVHPAFSDSMKLIDNLDQSDLSKSIKSSFVNFRIISYSQLGTF